MSRRSLNTCKECPGISKLQENLEHHFDEQMIEKQWTKTDRSTLETKTESVDDFVINFGAALTKVQQHDFITKQQSAFLRDTKESIKPGKFVYIVIGEFAENYSFVVQDAGQSFHWNNLHATIHPFVCYYQLQTDVTDTDLKHVSFVIISESNTHSGQSFSEGANNISYGTLWQTKEIILLLRQLCGTVQKS